MRTYGLPVALPTPAEGSGSEPVKTENGNHQGSRVQRSVERSVTGRRGDWSE